MEKSRERSEQEKQDLLLYHVMKRAKKGIEDIENDPDYPLNKATRTRKPVLFIEQDNADFYCREHLIKFNDPASINAKVFRAIFKHADGSGLASYEDINSELEKNGEKVLTERSKIIQRIRNAIHNLFRYSDLPNEIPSGEKLLEITRGKGIVFRNPKIN